MSTLDRSDNQRSMQATERQFDKLYSHIKNFPSPELDLSKESRLLRQLTEEFGFSKSVIEIYNHWVDEILPKQISAREIPTPNGSIRYGEVTLHKPRFVRGENSGKDEPLTPFMAREMGHTYQGVLTARPYYVARDDPLQTKIWPAKSTKIFLGNGTVQIGSIPIMLGSNKCWLNGLTDQQKVDLGESPNDPLGYFIIKGTEKVITIQERLRMQMHFLFENSAGRIENSITCATPIGTTVVSLLVGKKKQQLKVGLQHLGNKHLPVYGVFALLMVTPESFAGAYKRFMSSAPVDVGYCAIFMDNIVAMFTNLILSFCKNEERSSVYFSLQTSMHKIGSFSEIIEKVTTKRISKEALIGNDVAKYTIIRNDIIKDLFAHVPNTTSEEKAVAVTIKAKHLAFMISITIKHLLGIRKFDDRDFWGNKRLETAARSMEQLFGSMWGQSITRAIDNIKKHKDNPSKLDTPNVVRGAIPASEIGDNFEAAFGPNAWGLKSNFTKDNITDTLKAETPLAVYSQIGRVNTPSGRKGKMMGLRMLQPSQVGFICPLETPEGSSLGLLKNLSLLCVISMERPITDIERLLADESVKPFYSTSYVEGWIPFLLNGQFKGCTVPGDERCPKDVLGRTKTFLEVMLLAWRRNATLPYDCCISFNTEDNIVEYYCDGARPTRPLLIVDYDGQLVIDKKNLWGKTTAELLMGGAIEFIDAREQDFAMLAMFPDDVRNRYTNRAMLEDLVPKLDGYEPLLLERMNQQFGAAAADLGALVGPICGQLLGYYSQSLLTKAGGKQAMLTETLVNNMATNCIQAIKLYLKEIIRQSTQGSLVDVDKFSMDHTFSVAAALAKRYTDELITREISNDSTPASGQGKKPKEKLPKYKRNTGLEKMIADVIRKLPKADDPIVVAAKATKVQWERDVKMNPGDHSLKEKEPKIPIYLDGNELIVESIKEILDGFRVHLAKLQKEIPYTHSEIDPVEIYGIAGSLEPQPNCGQGPRATYQASMSKQALGYYHYNHHLRFDSSFKVMLHPTRPMFETIVAQSACLNTTPTGTTPICAFLVMGDNNEDAIIVKEEYINGINLEITKYSTHKCSASGVVRDKDYEEYFGRPDKRPGEPEGRYAAIGKNGLPELDKKIRPGDCIVGRLRRDGTGKIINCSLFAGVGEDGYVDRVLVTWNAKGQRVVKVKIRQFRKHISGDKVASRYAQKGTISRIISARDLPVVIGGVNDGLIPDFYINVHAIPSRMTMGKLKEMISSKAALYTGERVDATCFHPFNIDTYREQLKTLSMNEFGEEQMIWPDGTVMSDPVFVAPCYYQCLRHHVKDKIQMRARGNIKPTTHQPVDGRSNEGGLRVGEMERDALISHGCTGLLLERLMLVSDAYKTVMCRTCGNIAISNIIERKQICRVCKDDASFGVVTMPYVLKLVIHMLLAMQINVTMKLKQSFSDKVPEGKYLL